MKARLAHCYGLQNHPVFLIEEGEEVLFYALTVEGAGEAISGAVYMLEALGHRVELSRGAREYLEMIDELSDPDEDMDLSEGWARAERRLFPR